MLDHLATCVANFSLSQIVCTLPRDDVNVERTSWLRQPILPILLDCHHHPSTIVYRGFLN